MKRNLTLGIFAHVDAGKTTLSEAMLYLSGKIKKQGRVDHRTSYLDTHELERERGITIFSKQAVMELGSTRLFLLDTPGHVDFSSEAERAMQVIDGAVLVISGTDGVQAHTETLWRLLDKNRVPTCIFVTKMDLPGKGREAILEELKSRLDGSVADFGAEPEEKLENIATCSDTAMEEYLENGTVSDETVSAMISDRTLIPCFFGSGLKTDGVEALLECIDSFMPSEPCGEEFAAKVYKIGRDPQGNRMSFMKITGGELRVRAPVKYAAASGEVLEEKVSQIRIYSGIKYETVETAHPGEVCAVLGLSGSFAGQGLGAELSSGRPELEPVMSYRVILPDRCDARVIYPKLLQLQEEDPMLNIVWNSRTREISVLLMGRVQTEILKSLVKERFDVDIELDTGRVMYRETVKNKVEGVGHFEPLRHYAEVHLILEPMEPGSGLVLDTVCSEDELDRNWQRLILTHLAEKQHVGVLTGSPITDMKITLAAGRAHLKHTEGGDFRESTYRAVRQGLMQAESVLLEPWYDFTLEVPTEQTGRAITDVRAMGGSFDMEGDSGGLTRITGSAPVAKMNGYMAQVVSYSRGRGRLTLRPNGYRPCRDQQSIVDAIGYDAEADVENTADSVFCAHGAGYNVHWSQVKDYMHLESCLERKKTGVPASSVRKMQSIDERELEAIMEREFGPIRRREYSSPVISRPDDRILSAGGKKQYVIVDGYNVIFSWEELKNLAADRLDLARERLMDILSSYAAFTRTELVLVFDAYRTAGSAGSREDYHSIHVAYTRDGETADSYIQSLAGEVGKNYAVRIVTNDSLIRLSAMGSGVLRQSTREFEAQVDEALERINEILERTNRNAHTTKLKDGKQ